MVLVPCRSLAFVAFRHANPYGGFLLCVASLLSCLVGHRSDPYRTLIRSISDTVPDQTGHPSDPIGKLSDISPDDCPTSIGTLSALNRNAVRLQIGLVSGLRRNTHKPKESPRAAAERFRWRRTEADSPQAASGAQPGGALGGLGRWGDSLAVHRQPGGVCLPPPRIKG